MRIRIMLIFVLAIFLIIGCTNKDPNLDVGNNNQTQGVPVSQTDTITSGTGDNVSSETAADSITVIAESSETNPVVNPIEKTEPNEASVDDEPVVIQEPDDDSPPRDVCVTKAAENQICSGYIDIECVNRKAKLDSDGETVTFTIKNKLTGEIEINDIISYKEEEPWHCMSICIIKSVDIDVGDGLVGISSKSKIQPGTAADVKITCSGLNGYVDQGFEVIYTSGEEKHNTYFKVIALKE